MKKKLILLFGALFFASILSLSLLAEQVWPHCNVDPNENIGVCMSEISGGSVCTANPCGGWFQPNCNCYETDFGDPPPQP